MRWLNYFTTEGDDKVAQLWERLATRPVLLVIGGGFDPRVARSLRCLAPVANGNIDVVRIGFIGEDGDPRMAALAAANRTEVDNLVVSAGGSVFELPAADVSAARSAGLSTSHSFQKGGFLQRYEQIVVDISGLPRAVYFPLIRGILHVNENQWTGDLHVLACDSQLADRALLQEGAEAPGPLGGFSGPSDYVAWAATVWVPVLGEGIGEQLSVLLEEIRPDEVIPVLPFPSSNPRRSDDLILEHRELLDALVVEPRNYLYAAENNPYDLYRAVVELHRRYQASLRPLGAARFVLSTHSSRLLSIGVLLAAYEIGLRVMHVSPSRYGLRLEADPAVLAIDGQLTDLWLTGEPYR